MVQLNSSSRRRGRSADRWRDFKRLVLTRIHVTWTSVNPSSGSGAWQFGSHARPAPAAPACVLTLLDRRCSRKDRRPVRACGRTRHGDRPWTVATRQEAFRRPPRCRGDYALARAFPACSASARPAKAATTPQPDARSPSASLPAALPWAASHAKSANCFVSASRGYAAFRFSCRVRLGQRDRGGSDRPGREYLLLSPLILISAVVRLPPCADATSLLVMPA